MSRFHTIWLILGNKDNLYRTITTINFSIESTIPSTIPPHLEQIKCVAYLAVTLFIFAHLPLIQFPYFAHNTELAITLFPQTPLGFEHFSFQPAYHHHTFEKSRFA